MDRVRRREVWLVASLALLGCMALGCGRSRSGGDDRGRGPDRGRAELLCEPNQFLSCNGGSAVYCDADGFETVEVPCPGAGCDESAGGCGCVARTATCENDIFVRCGDQGRIVEAAACPVGCNQTPGAEPSCQKMVVANAIHAGIDCDYDIVGDYAPTADEVIDTNDDRQCDVVHEQFEGEPMCIRVYERIVVPQGVTIRVTGERGLVMMALRRVDIQGVIDASASGSNAGPGAVALGVGRSGMGSAGGGGAGHNVQGADGGSADATGGGAGASYGLASIIPLLGGSSGGNGGGGAIGGAGGGAIQIASCGAFSMGPTSVLDASGGGGAGGAAASGGTPGGGAGGGSGGAILIEAARVTLAPGATIVANGGGGGGGGGATQSGAQGSDGGRVATGAQGGAGGSAGGRGGSGGARDGAAVAGAQAGVNAGGGGGGGAPGRLRINVRPGGTPTINSALISPNAAIHVVGIQR